MPNAPVHIFFGALITMGILFVARTGNHTAFSGLLSGYTNLFLLVLVVYLYSQGPDIDHQNSIVTREFTAAGLLLTCYLLFQNLVNHKPLNAWLLFLVLGSLTVVWTARTFKKLKHRGFFHSFPAAVLLSLPVAYYLNLEYGFIAATVYCSHFVIDRIDTARKRKQDGKRR